MLALTGGTGFVGGHVLTAAASAGATVRALTRRPQPPRPGVEWIEGPLDDPVALSRLCDGADAVLHIAGAINVPTRAAFDAANVLGTQAMLAAATQAGVRRFVQVSSLAAREPSLSDYGTSKAAADSLVQASVLDWVIVRPPAVYGPGDREMLELFRLIARGFAPAIGAGRFSLIHVADLAAGLLSLATAVRVPQTVFEIDDGRAGGVSHAGFARLAGQALGSSPRIISVAPSLLRLAANAATAAARLAGVTPKLTPDRARYFSHPDWTADSAPLRATGLWRPQIPLERGLADTVVWYRAQGWLPALPARANPPIARRA